MKKLISLLLAMIMVFSLATVVGAATYDKDGNEVTNVPAGPTYNDVKTITLTKEYKATNADTTSPAETFTFSSLTCTGVTNAGVVPGTQNPVTKDNAPIPTIGTVEYTAGQAGSANAKKDITITLPDYTAVGVYTYTFNEIAGTTAGVTYNTDTITLVVTVVEQNGKVRVAAVHTEGQGETKSDEFANEYSAGELAVKKIVTGNLGDKDKDFTVTVTFTAPQGLTVNEAISYTDDGVEKTIAAGWNTTATATITLQHDETVTFTNIPYGVKYTVVETDYAGEGYDAAHYAHKFNVGSITIIAGAEDTINIGSESKPASEYIDMTINTPSDYCEITNNKSANVDTGIALDSAPYFLMLAVALFGMVALVSKKRYEV